MKLLRAVGLVAVLAVPASAQQLPNINLMQDGPSKTDEEKAAEAERDQRYKETLKKIPDAKAANDPWGGMRSEPPKAAAAPKSSVATKKSRTGTSAN
jgi:hypothetical protein